MIYLRKTTRKHQLNLHAMERAARALLVAAGEPSATLSLSLVGDAAIRRMNREHRGKDCATDVLSFPLSDAGHSEPNGCTAAAPERMLGDVVISLDRAVRQARDYDATLDAEVRRLLIHGVLHLLGHDHERPRQRAQMVREERRLAVAIGLAWPYPRTPS